MPSEISMTVNRTLSGLLGLALCAVPASVSANSGMWLEDEFNMVIREQSLRDVLLRFGVLAGVPVVLSDGVEATVSARFQGATGEDIVAALAREYALDWRFDGRRLEVSSNSEQVSRILSMEGVTLSDLDDALEALSAHDSKFPISAIDGELAFVVGPPRYVGIVEIVLSELVEKRIADEAKQEAERLAENRRAAEQRKLEEARRLAALERPAPVQAVAPRQVPLVNRGGRWEN